MSVQTAVCTMCSKEETDDNKLIKTCASPKCISNIHSDCLLKLIQNYDTKCRNCESYIDIDKYAKLNKSKLFKSVSSGLEIICLAIIILSAVVMLLGSDMNNLGCMANKTHVKSCDDLFISVILYTLSLSFIGTVLYVTLPGIGKNFYGFFKSRYQCQLLICKNYFCIWTGLILYATIMICHLIGYLMGNLFSYNVGFFTLDSGLIGFSCLVVVLVLVLIGHLLWMYYRSFYEIKKSNDIII